MQTIAVAARKGGSGKTTLTAHLAVQCQIAGNGPVTLVDTDPQGSLSSWWNDRQVEAPQMLDISLNRLPAEVNKVKSAPGFLFVDTPPLDSAVIASVFKVADLIVIPVKPSPHDLRGVSVTVDLCKKAGKPFLFVVNQAVPRASLTLQASLILSQHGPVSTTIVFNRVDYAGAMTDGRTVQEIDPRGKAAAEIAALWEYVSRHVSGSVVQQISKSVAGVA